MSCIPRSARVLRTISFVLSLALVLSLAPISPAMAAGATYYVATTGSDTAAGTLAAPLRTIQAAVTKASAGDTVYVRGGTYAERPDFNHSGTSAAPIVFAPYGTEAVTISQGISVSGSYNKISGFTITPGASSGAQIAVSGSNNVIDRMVQRDTYRGGTRAANVTGSDNLVSNIDFSGTGAIVAAAPGVRNRFSGGTIHHTGGMFALADGANYTTFEYLDMHDSGQVDRTDNGADGINLNAHHVTIRNNQLYNIFIFDPIQHVDAIQWWNTADDLIIENNRFGSKKFGGLLGEADYGHIQFETVAGKTSQRVIIRNNLFLGTQSYYNIRSSLSQVTMGSADDWQIIGNTFADGKEIRGDMLANMRNLKIQDNVFFTTNRLQKASGSVYDNNAYVGAPKNATDGPGTIEVADAGFVNPDFSAAANYGRNADLHLKSTSPLIGKGASLAALPSDISGFTRKSPTSIGAYEYGSTSTTPPPTTTDPTVTTPAPDTTPPTGWFTINGGATETTSNVVAIKNYVTGATKLRVDSGTGYGAWTPYVDTFSLTLPAGDGVKPVAIQYADDAGNTLDQATQIALVTPVVTTPAPTGTMSVNAGAASTKTTAVTVDSNVSGATQMRFDTGAGFGAWVAYAPTANVSLPAGDGVKTVNAEYQNAGGTLALSDAITLDTVAPDGWFTVNNGAKLTNSATVAIKNYVNGAAKLRVDTGAGYGAWTPYLDTFSLTLPAGDGVKPVAIQYADDAGNVLDQATTITLDTAAPVGAMNVNGGATSTDSTSVGVFSTVVDAIQMRIDTGTGFGAWMPYNSYAPATLPTGDGLKTVRVEYLDAAGNTLALTSTITLTTPAPPVASLTGTFTLNSGAIRTYSYSVTGYCNVTGATEMRIDTGSGFGAWVAYSTNCPITLSAPNGTKLVKAEYRNAAGQTLQLSDTIELRVKSNKR